MMDNNRPFWTKVRATFLSGALALSALAIAFTQMAEGKAGKNESKAEPPKVAVDNNPLKRETKLSTSFAPVVKKVAPSVVNVFTTKTVKNPMPDLVPFFDDPFWRRFFGSPFDDNGGRRGL